MTSEVCVMNRRALVLAADSAVTVSRWNDEGAREERYFKGANKIFQISNYSPVGMMIFDTADLHRMPWEIIAKEYRKQLQDNKHGNLENYANDFFDYVKNNSHIFTAEQREEIFIEVADRAMFRNLVIANNSDAVKAAAGDEAATEAARNEELDKIHHVMEVLPIEASITQAEIDSLIALYHDRLLAEAETDLRIFAPGSTYPVQKIVEIGVNAVFKAADAYLSETGIVIAGYGDDEYFPEYIEFSCFGLFGSHLLIRRAGENKITRGSTGSITAFAMKNMVDTFYAGFSADVFGAVQSQLSETLTKIAPDIIAAVGGTATELPSEVIEKIVNAHKDAWTREIFDKHAKPFTSVIGSLPIDEMANLAETLVMLESLKEKVTKPSESVGGPIDVAVITKSEGFLWIKRKHFFDPALNPRYLHRQHLS